MRPLTFNARSKLTHPYESAWSITQKLGLWNAVDTADIIKYLPALATVAVEPAQLTAAVNHLRHRTGLPMPDGEGLWLNAYLPVFALGDRLRSKFIRENLAYCPLCLEGGFHSPLHQFAWLEECPWHAVRLHYCCAECGNPVAWSERSECLRASQFLCPHCRRALHGGATIRIAGQLPQGAEARANKYLEWTRKQTQEWTGPAARRAMELYRYDRNGMQAGDVVLAALNRCSDAPLPEAFFTHKYGVKTLTISGQNVQAIDELIQQFGLFAVVEAWLIWREGPDGTNPSTLYIERLIERAFRFQNGKRELPAVFRRRSDVVPRLTGMIGVMLRPDCCLSSAFEWIRLHFLERGYLGSDRAQVYTASEIAVVAEAKGLVTSAFADPQRLPDATYRRRLGVAHVFNAQMQLAPDFLHLLRSAMALHIWYVLRDALNAAEGTTLQEWLPRSRHDPFVVSSTLTGAEGQPILRTVFAKRKVIGARTCQAVSRCLQCSSNDQAAS